MASTETTHRRQRIAYKNAEKAIASTAGISEKEVTIFVGKGTAKTNEPFVILFYQTLMRIMSNEGLTLTDLKVMLKILDYVNLGNIVHLTHQEIAHGMGIQRPQVTKSIKRLIDADLLILSPKKSLFVNPTIMAKENLRVMKESEAYECAVVKAKQNGRENEITY